MVYSCCFSKGGNLDFPEFLKRSFKKINYWSPFPFYDSAIDPNQNLFEVANSVTRW